jgi:hypothetical protein
MNEPRTYYFREASTLVKWTKLSIYAQIVMACVSLYSGLLEHDLLEALRSGDFESEEAMMSAATTSDTRQQRVAIANLIIVLTSGILILGWISRANANIRALGARGMEYTPTLAVVMFFIPILSFWKPFQAVREIWKASTDPADPDRVDTPRILGVWWFLWITFGLVNQVSLRLTLAADEVDELLMANTINFWSDVIAFPLCFVLLTMIDRIQGMQNALHAATHDPSVASP